MSTTSRKRKDRYGFALPGWPPATTRTGVESAYARRRRLRRSRRCAEASTPARCRISPADRGWRCGALCSAAPTRSWATRPVDGAFGCLTAVESLGWKTANSRVRSGISDGLGHLLAEQGDNAYRKPLTQAEQAARCRELKGPLAEDAARRQEASRFTGTGDYPRSDGGATVAPPSILNGKTRKQDALIVTVERATAQVARCRHGGGTVEHSPITTMPVEPFAPRGGAKNGRGLPSTKSSSPRSP